MLNIVMCVVCIGIVYVCMGKGAIYNSSLQLAQEPYIINRQRGLESSDTACCRAPPTCLSHLHIHPNYHQPPPPPLSNPNHTTQAQDGENHAAMPITPLRLVSRSQNGVGAFVLQCKRLEFNYCDWAGSSRGMK